MDLQLLDFRRSIKNPLTDNNIIKIDIFVIKFFFKTGIVDFSDIKTEATMEQKVFNISPIILKNKINKLIKSLLNKKALKLNSILNKIFKIIALVIAEDLAKATNYYFTNKIILKSLKKSITIVLYKKGKKIIFF